jgi:hypothetical protein
VGVPEFRLSSKSISVVNVAMPVSSTVESFSHLRYLQGYLT